MSIHRRWHATCAYAGIRPETNTRHEGEPSIAGESDRALNRPRLVCGNQDPSVYGVYVPLCRMHEMLHGVIAYNSASAILSYAGNKRSRESAEPTQGRYTSADDLGSIHGSSAALASRNAPLATGGPTLT
jgi:hypothetical protein